MKNNKRKKIIKLIFVYYAIVIILLILGFTFSKYLITASGEATINTSKFAFKITEQMSGVELELSDTITANLYSQDKLVPRK